MNKCYYNKYRECPNVPLLCTSCEEYLRYIIKKLAEANPNHCIYEMFYNTMEKAGLTEEKINALYEIGWYI